MFYYLFPALAAPGFAGAACELFYQLSQLLSCDWLMTIYETIFC